MLHLFLKILLNIATKQFYFKRKYWLLVDNIFNNDAELVDNFSLFEYMQSQEEFKDNVFYIINKNNIQYEEIKRKYKNIIPIEYCKINFNLVSKLFFTKYWLDSFQVMHKFNLRFKNFLAQGKIITIYTQHGINFFKRFFWDTDEIGDKYYKKIIFSNKTERDLFKQYFGFDDKNTIIAGLSRWDNMLQHSQEKSIFIYFTFRRYLCHKGLDITETNYYKNIENLLHSERLQQILNKYNVKIYLGMHHVLRKKTDLSNCNIEIIEDCDIGRVKQNASMLISDYSSMCFDFMFNDRPVAFYRVDKADPLLLIDKAGYINELHTESKNKDLYNIFYDADSTIDCIEKYCQNNFELEPEYKKINNNFFEYRDNIKKHIVSGILSSEEDIQNNLDKIPEKPLEYGVYSFSKDMPIATDGIGFIEHFGRRSIGYNSNVWIKLLQKSSGYIIFNVKPILNKKVKKRKIKIYINDTCYNEITLDNKEISQIKLPYDLTNSNTDIIKITFEYGKVKSPSRLGISRDSRKLAINFLSLEITKD